MPLPSLSALSLGAPTAVRAPSDALLHSMLPDELIASILEAISLSNPFGACADVAHWCSVNLKNHDVCRQSEGVWEAALRSFFDEYEVDALFVAHHLEAGAATPWRNRFYAACRVLQNELLRVPQVRRALGLSHAHRFDRLGYGAPTGLEGGPLTRTEPWHHDLGLVIVIANDLRIASQRLRSSADFVLKHFPSLPDGTADALQGDADFVALAALQHPRALANASGALRGTPPYLKAARAAIMRDHRAFFYAKEYFEADVAVVQHVVQQRGQMLKHASPDLRADKPTVMLAVANDPQAIKFASIELRDDRDVMMLAVRANGSALAWASYRLAADDEPLILAAVTNNGLALMHTPRDRATSFEVAKAAVAQNGEALQYVRPRSRQFDPDVVRLAAAHPYNVVYWNDAVHGDAIRALLRDKDFVRTLAKAGNPSAFVEVAGLDRSGNPLYEKDLALQFVASVSVHMLSVMFDGGVAPAGGQLDLKGFSHWGTDRDVVLAAARRNGEVIGALDRRNDLLHDDAVLMQAIRTTPSALQFVPNEKKSDELVKLAVEQRGSAIMWATPAQRRSATELVHAALRQDGLALFHVPYFANDEEAVLIAVEQEGMALQHANVALKRKLTVVIAALRQTLRAEPFVGGAIEYDDDYKAALFELRKARIPAIWANEVQARRERDDNSIEEEIRRSLKSLY